MASKPPSAEYCKNKLTELFDNAKRGKYGHYSEGPITLVASTGPTLFVIVDNYNYHHTELWTQLEGHARSLIGKCSTKTVQGPMLFGGFRRL